jgi:transcriptional regulatory protein GAL4
VYEARPNRTALTRSNFDAAERRIKQLETLIHSRHPEIDIETEIKKLENLSSNSRQPPGGRGGDDEDASLDEDYEWNEALVPADEKELEHEGDGMASSPTPTSGYLGKSHCPLPKI